jgi:predicted nuclease with RNAse H fold
MQKDDLNKSLPIKIDSLYKQQHRVIAGIDLTGSAKRPSGFCIMQNAYAVTYRVREDEEMLTLIQEFKPDLISLDSPLSLPFCRISPFDDDPGRTKYGINRSCERLLVARGIRSYPPLIQSMQKLTQRGIALANRLRSMGYPVIESYPGGAQDILGIPRKKKGIDLLITGLSNFGILGNYIQEKTSHDEIDAITCALVGLFYLDGKYEALGNEQEGFLILPRLS